MIARGAVVWQNLPGQWRPAAACIPAQTGRILHVGGVPKFEILPILAKLGFRFLADRSDYSDKFFVDESHKKQKLYTFCYRRI